MVTMQAWFGLGYTAVVLVELKPHACLEVGLWLVKKPSCPFLLLLGRQRSSKRQATGLELPLLGSDLEPEHFLNVTLGCLSRPFDGKPSVPSPLRAVRVAENGRLKR